MAARCGEARVDLYLLFIQHFQSSLKMPQTFACSRQKVGFIYTRKLLMHIDIQIYIQVRIRYLSRGIRDFLEQDF